MNTFHRILEAVKELDNLAVDFTLESSHEVFHDNAIGTCKEG